MSECDKEDKQRLLVLLGEVGNHPKFLTKLFFICMIPSILNGIHLTNSVFLAELPQFWCDVPELEKANWTLEQKREFSSPSGSDKSSCEMFDRDYAAISSMSYMDALIVGDMSSNRTVPCSKHTFNPATPSMAATFDLVCDRSVMRSNVQFALSLGKFLGSIVGLFSDKFGRRKVFLYFTLLYVFAGPVIAFAENFGMVVVGRVLLGIASAAVYNIPYTVLVECANPYRRDNLAILYNMSYPVGMMIMPLLAYYIRDWRMLQSIISVPSILLPLFWWLMPESPMWLLSKGRTKEASLFIETEFKKIQSAGQAEITLDKVSKDESVVAEPGDKVLPPSKTVSIGEKFKTSLKEFFLLIKISELRLRLFIFLGLHAVLVCSYYGLALNVEGFDKYLYSFLSGLFEVVSYLLPLPLLKWMGRKNAAAILFFTAAVGLLTVLAIPNTKDFNMLSMIIVLSGRVCLSGVSAVVILQSSELFPTVVRATATGVYSLGAHIGSMSAPFIVALGSRMFTNTLFGAMALVAGTVILFLPETKNKPLPNSIQDISESPKKSKIGCHQFCH